MPGPCAYAGRDSAEVFGVELYGILEREEQYDVVRAVRRIEVHVSEP